MGTKTCIPTYITILFFCNSKHNFKKLFSIIIPYLMLISLSHFNNIKVVVKVVKAHRIYRTAHCTKSRETRFMKGLCMLCYVVL